MHELQERNMKIYASLYICLSISVYVDLYNQIKLIFNSSDMY